MQRCMWFVSNIPLLQQKKLIYEDAGGCILFFEVVYAFLI